MDNKKNGIPKLRFPGFTGAWEQRKLGEVVNIFSGWSPSNFKEGDSGSDIFIKVDDLNHSTREQLNSQMNVLESQKYKKIPKGSTIFPKRGAAIMTNKVRILGKSAYMDTNMMALEASDISSEFLYTFITKTGLFKIADTSTIPQINNKHINPYPIKLPTMPEQKQIGKFFKQLDTLIALHQRKLEHLQEQKKGLLQKMFPKNGETVPEVRFPGFTDAWEQRKLGEVVERFDNLRIPVTSSKREKGITPYYGANGIQDYVQGYTHDGEFVLVAEDGANDLQNYPVHYVNGKVWVNNHAHVLQGKNKMVDNLFLVNAIKQIKIETYLVGGSRAKLNADVMMKLPIKVPTFNEQQKIGEYFSKFDTLIALHQRKLEHLELMKKGLLQQMFV